MSAPTKDKKRPTMDAARIRMLRETDPAPAHIVEAAEERFAAGLLALALSHSAFTSRLITKCYHKVPTTQIDTMAVAAAGDGSVVLMFNPYFTLSLKSMYDVAFILHHEGKHMVLRHIYAGEDLVKQKNYTMACEGIINHLTMHRLAEAKALSGNTKSMPAALTRMPDGTVRYEPTGVDPRELYKRYTDAMAKQKEPAASETDFYDETLTTLYELSRIKDDEQDGGSGAEGEGSPTGCVHADGSAPGVDQESLDDMMKSVVESLASDARRGSEQARKELLELAKMTGESTERASTLWGNYGIMDLRGQTSPTRKVEWWKIWLTEVVGSLLTPGERLVFPKKTAGIYMALGQDPMLKRRGKQTQKHIMVFLDTSGSMSDQVLKYISEKVGHEDGVTIEFLMFDGSVETLIPGESVRGGGGTNFQNCVDYAEGRYAIDGQTFDGDVDAVLMVTDGHAPHVTPAEKDKWIWLITDGGDTWPEGLGMKTHRVDSTEQD